jgi:putative chitinase
MLGAARAAGITSRAEIANFMAQISAESRNLTALEESFHYTRGIDQIPVRWARREGDAALENARLEARAHRGGGLQISVAKRSLNIRAEHVWDLP